MGRGVQELSYNVNNAYACLRISHTKVELIGNWQFNIFKLFYILMD